MNTINDKLVASSYSVPSNHFDSSVQVQTEIKDELSLGESKPDSASLIEVSRDKVEDVSEEKLDALMLESNLNLLNVSDSLKFEKHEGSGRNVYSLVDSETRSVLKQFPSEDFLKVSADLKVYLEGRQDQSSIGNLVSSKI